ncbi:MAG: amidohydrolase family protein [Gammaproteobacteria bacterium]
MQVNDMIIVSVDDHIIEPPNLFEKHLTTEQKAFAPKHHRTPQGDFWVYAGRKIASGGLNAVIGRPREEYGCEPMSLDDMRKGMWDVHARIEDMNACGILGSMNFGSFVGFDGGLFLADGDRRQALTVLRAYNDWHIDEWCGAYPGRFIALPIMPVWDVAETVREIRRVHAKGARAFTFIDNPARRGLPSIHNEAWEPLWAVCNELEMVICCHIGSGNAAPHPSLESPISAWITAMPISIALTAADWIHLSALNRYPKLRIALSEGGIGWIPYFLERASYVNWRQGIWTHTDFGGRTVAEVFREHFITCFIDDVFGIQNRAAIGVENICYECDYPHSDSLWPQAPEYLLKSMQGVPDDEIDKMSHLNAMRFFHYDPFAVLGRQNCTVGALRAQATHVDIRERSYGGARPLAAGEAARTVTSGDIERMMASMQAQGMPASAA